MTKSMKMAGMECQKGSPFKSKRVLPMVRWVIPVIPKQDPPSAVQLRSDGKGPLAPVQAERTKDFKAPADSTDRRNTLGKLLCWGFVLQGLSRALVELSGNRTEFRLTVCRHIEAAREVLSKKSVGVFVAAALPG